MTNIGIDPHKASLTAAAVDSAGKNLGTRRFTMDKGTGAAVCKWAAGFPDPLFAVEGAKGLGHNIAQYLAAHERNVVDVPATLSMRVRVLETGGSRKSDPDDAQAVARAAMYRDDLHVVEAEDQCVVLDLWCQQRDAVKAERNRTLNRLHKLFRELLSGGVPRGLDADEARAAMRRVRPASAADRCRRELARELVKDLDRMDKQMPSYAALLPLRDGWSPRIEVPDRQVTGAGEHVETRAFLQQDYGSIADRLRALRPGTPGAAARAPHDRVHLREGNRHLRMTLRRNQDRRRPPPGVPPSPIGLVASRERHRIAAALRVESVKPGAATVQA